MSGSTRGRCCLWKVLNQREVMNMVSYCANPKNISMFAVSSPKTLLLCLSCGFFISRLFGVAALAALPQWVSALSAEACLWRDEERAASFFCPIQQYSVMPKTLNPEHREKRSTPLHTCSSYENARLRLENLRQSIKNWMEATIRSEFPEATKTRSRLRKLPHGRVRYCASVRSHGVYLSFSTYSLTAFSAAVTRAGAKHRIHHNTL